MAFLACLTWNNCFRVDESSNLVDDDGWRRKIKRQRRAQINTIVGEWMVT